MCYKWKINGKKYCIVLAEFCVILESIGLNCAEGYRIIRGAEFLEDILYLCLYL